MELTINQTLQKGILAHKEGKLHEAEDLYRAILKAQPLHSDANHNLGILMGSLNKTEEALSLFKTALEVNSKIEQYWLSYIDALIKARQFEDANRILNQAKKQGLAEDKFNSLKAQIIPLPEIKNSKNASPPQQLLDNLLEYYQVGKYGEAEKLALSITKEFPQHQVAWKILGAVLGQTGRNSEALHAKQTAIVLSPQDANTHSNLGNTYRKLGRLKEAEASYIKAIQIKPDFAEAHGNLGNTLKEAGRLEEAEASYTIAIELKPDYVETYNNLGVTLQELGRLIEAKVSFSKAIKLKPDFAEAHSNLGNTLTELGRLQEAEASYRQAIKSKPNLAEAHSNLGNMLKEFGRLEEAGASYRNAIALKPENIKAHYNLGNTLKELGRLEEAVGSYNKAITLKPDFAEAQNNLGVTLKELSRLEEAEVSYTKAINLKPDYADAYLNLFELLEKTNRIDEILLIIGDVFKKVFEKKSDLLFYEALALFRKENYEAAEKLIAKIHKDELDEQRKSGFIMLKANYYDYKNDYNSAFKEFKSMNENIRNSTLYKKQNSERYFNQEKDKISQLKILQQQTSYKSAIKVSWYQPTFLIGFPRSGTTLLDTILRSHSQIVVAEELPMLRKMKESFGSLTNISMIEEIDSTTAEIASGVYFEELKKHIEIGKNTVVIDKLPLNILQLTLINQIFPKAQFILALRHPLDCVLSCWMQNFNLNPAMANMIKLDRIADFYCTAMEILKLSQERYSLNIHRIRYEDLVLDFERQVSNLLTFLNLEWENELKNYQKTALARGRINTPSYSQVIKPIYKTASYRWKNYEKYLHPIKQRLNRWINDYNYTD